MRCIGRLVVRDKLDRRVTVFNMRTTVIWKKPFSPPIVTDVSCRVKLVSAEIVFLP